MIDVLLARYNGEKYLPELLASLERQTFADWRLIIRDDGSADGTPLLIEQWAKEHAGKVRVIQDSRNRLGSRANFSSLLQVSDAPYFMFCDQDDVWLPDKMTSLLNAVRDAETRRGPRTPILAHSDLVVVDESQRPANPYFWRQQGIHPTSGHSNRGLIIQNRVTGCALMGNSTLRSLSLPIPQVATKGGGG